MVYGCRNNKKVIGVENSLPLANRNALPPLGTADWERTYYVHFEKELQVTYIQTFSPGRSSSAVVLLGNKRSIIWCSMVVWVGVAKSNCDTDAVQEGDIGEI